MQNNKIKKLIEKNFNKMVLIKTTNNEELAGVLIPFELGLKFFASQGFPEPILHGFSGGLFMIREGHITHLGYSNVLEIAVANSREADMQAKLVVAKLKKDLKV